MEVIGVDESYCYAWTPIGEGHFLAVLADFTGAPDFKPMLNEILGLVNMYTGEFAAPTPKAEEIGDGLFSLPCGSQSVVISCPDGWTGEAYADFDVWIYPEDMLICGDYYYLEGYTLEEVEQYWIQPDVDSMKSEDVFVSYENADFGNYTARVLVGKDVSYYYAYVPYGDGCLLTYIYDSDGGNDAAEWLPMLTDCIIYE